MLTIHPCTCCCCVSTEVVRYVHLCMVLVTMETEFSILSAGGGASIS